MVLKSQLNIKPMHWGKHLKNLRTKACEELFLPMQNAIGMDMKYLVIPLIVRPIADFELSLRSELNERPLQTKQISW